MGFFLRGRNGVKVFFPSPGFLSGRSPGLPMFLGSRALGLARGNGDLFSGLDQLILWEDQAALDNGRQVVPSVGREDVPRGFCDTIR